MPRVANTAGCHVEESGEICGRKVYGHGMCSRHYSRWRRWGDPLGSAPRPTLEDRFWAKVDKRGPDECWPWTACISPAGYGQIGLGQKLQWAHRVSYELHVGPIPEGYDIDHLCHTRDETCRLGDTCPHRRCVNPAHLEAVPPLVNVMRSRCPQADNARKTKCHNGHLFDEKNTRINADGSRDCKQCERDERQRLRAEETKRRALGLPPPTFANERCSAGHLYEVNCYGQPWCRTCVGKNLAKRRRKARESKPPKVLKLSDDDVARVRRLVATGAVSQGALAREYDVTPAYISLIVKRKTRIGPIAP